MGDRIEIQLRHSEKVGDRIEIQLRHSVRVGEAETQEISLPLYVNP
jgi:hypothetical protein